MDVRQNLLQFRMQLMRHIPFYGDILLRLPIRESHDVATAATNGRHILYNPGFLGRHAQGEQNFIIMHEVLHVLLKHSWRTPGTQQEFQLWNVACDLIVNNILFNRIMPQLLQQGITIAMPSDALYTSLSYDTTAENLYAQLCQKYSDQRHLKRVKLEVTGPGLRPNTKTVELPIPDDLLPIGIRPEEMPAEISRLQDMVRNALAEASKSSHLPGTGRCYIPPAVYEMVQVRPLDWRKLLRGMLEQKISDDASYATPERKYLHMDLILPGHTLDEEVLEDAWVFVDSSGSISQEGMSTFLTQLYHLLRSMRCTLNICFWDTQVTDVYRNIRTEKALADCLPHHSGGTNINCVYQWLRENKVKPDVMIILTDGYYGRLFEEEMAAKLRRRTLLLLEGRIAIGDEMKKIGRTTRLTE